MNEDKMDDVKHLMKDHYLKYASYVILDRAIPNVVDGLKPVQRRILFMLWKMHDGKLHKVANVAGQTMAYHPHGDAPITEALINMANKEYLLDQQGNFGNLFTGDPAAASRYIETRLSALALETLFNPELTETIPTYDGRHQEPVSLPAKIPVVLMHGAEGIAVGMATSILPHNFKELLEAEIAILQGETCEILPDFPTGGILDPSGYEHGKGKVKLRTRIEIKDPKTLVIREICYGTTTESLIRSIDEAAKKGKIKIESIHDYTSDKVEIEIKLPRGQYAEDIINALYAYTECEVALTSQIIVIKDHLPWQPDVMEILHFHVEKLQGYLKRELEIQQSHLLAKIFDKTLEQIFIENRLYKKIEEVKNAEQIDNVIEKSLVPFHNQLERLPTKEDRDKLLNIPIRRISRFDIEKNQEELAEIRIELGKIEKELKNVKKYTINYLKKLLDKYGDLFPRRTKIKRIEQLDMRAIETRTIKVGYDPVGGFIGTKVAGPETITCTNFDKLLLMYKDGSYLVCNIPEKQYVHQDGKTLTHFGAADKKTVFIVAYRDPKNNIFYAKRFIINKFILDKQYRYVEEGMKVEVVQPHPEIKIEALFVPKVNQRVSKIEFAISDVPVKGVTAKGNRISSKPIKKVVVR